MLMHSDLDIGIFFFKKKLGFFEIDEVLVKFLGWVGLCLCDLKTSCIASYVH